MVTAGGGGGFSVVVDSGLGSVALVVPSVVGGAQYIKIIITYVKKYAKGKNYIYNNDNNIYNLRIQSFCSMPLQTDYKTSCKQLETYSTNRPRGNHCYYNGNIVHSFLRT